MLRRRRLSSTTVKKKSKHVSNDSSDFWADQVLILSKASNKTLLSLTAPVLSAQRWELQKTESSNSSSVLLWSREITRTIRDAEPRTATSTFTQLLGSECVCVQVQCCFTSTETTRTIRDREPRTATLTFTQLLSSELKAKIDDVHRYTLKEMGGRGGGGRSGGGEGVGTPCRFVSLSTRPADAVCYWYHHHATNATSH